MATNLIVPSVAQAEDGIKIYFDGCTSSQELIEALENNTFLSLNGFTVQSKSCSSAPCTIQQHVWVDVTYANNRYTANVSTVSNGKIIDIDAVVSSSLPGLRAKLVQQIPNLYSGQGVDMASDSTELTKGLLSKSTDKKSKDEKFSLSFKRNKEQTKSQDKVKEKKAKDKVKEKKSKNKVEKKERVAKQYDPYSSFGLGYTSVEPLGVSGTSGENALTAHGLYLELNKFTAKAFRMSVRVGGNFTQEETNSLSLDNYGEVYQQLAWQGNGQLTLDKVFLYNKPLQLFVGTGIDVGYGTHNYNTVNQNNDGEAIVGSTESDSGLGLHILAGGGVTYTIKSLGVKAGYLTPVVPLLSGGIAYDVPMIHLGLTFAK